MRGTPSRAIWIASVNLLLLVIIGGGLELVFGTWFSPDPLDHLNIQRDLSIKVDASTLYPGGTIHAYQRDHWGFRGRGRDPASIDILTLGGSTTNQLYIPEEATWQKVMERRLAEKGRPLTVANGGFDGQTTIGILYGMDAWLPHVPGLHPKVVLAYVGINDSLLAPTTTDRLTFSSIHKWINYNSAIVRLFRSVKLAFLAHAEKLTHGRFDFSQAQWTDTPAMIDNRTARPESDPVAYADRLREIATRVFAMGATPVFVTQSRGDYRVRGGSVTGVETSDGMNGVDQWRLLDEFNRTTLSVCAELETLCLNLAGSLSFDDDDFYDFVHHTPAGATKIGTWLADRMADWHN